jgi:hypothetical protein
MRGPRVRFLRKRLPPTLREQTDALRHVGARAALDHLLEGDPMAAQIKDTIIETFKLDRENVDMIIAKLESLIHEGNVRRVLIKDARGVAVIEVPLTFGLVGVALVPVWAAIAAIAAIAADFTLQVERKTEDAS